MSEGIEYAEIIYKKPKIQLLNESKFVLLWFKRHRIECSQLLFNDLSDLFNPVNILDCFGTERITYIRPYSINGGPFNSPFIGYRFYTQLHQWEFTTRSYRAINNDAFIIKQNSDSIISYASECRFPKSTYIRLLESCCTEPDLINPYNSIVRELWFLNYPKTRPHLIREMFPQYDEIMNSLDEFTAARWDLVFWDVVIYDTVVYSCTFAWYFTLGAGVVWVITKLFGW